MTLSPMRMIRPEADTASQDAVPAGTGTTTQRARLLLFQHVAEVADRLERRAAPARSATALDELTPAI